MKMFLKLLSILLVLSSTIYADVIFSKTDTEKSEKIHMGEILTVKIPYQPGTGYSWYYKNNGNINIVEKIGPAFSQDIDGEEAMPGCYCHEIFKFKANKIGKMTLEFELKQPNLQIFDAKSKTTKMRKLQLEVTK